MSVLFVVGDRVRITAPDCPLLQYEHLALGRPMGTVKRWRNGKVRVEVDGTSSQDTEGHNCWADYRPDQLELITPAAVERMSDALLEEVKRTKRPANDALREATARLTNMGPVYVFPASWKGTSCELDQMVREGRAVYDQPLPQESRFLVRFLKRLFR